jgi:hypothetical protein
MLKTKSNASFKTRLKLQHFPRLCKGFMPMSLSAAQPQSNECGATQRYSCNQCCCHEPGIPLRLAALQTNLRG